MVDPSWAQPLQLLQFMISISAPQVFLDILPEFSSAMSWSDRQSLVLYGLFMVLAVAGWKTQGDAGLVLFTEDELATVGWFLGIPLGGHPTFSGAKGWDNLLHVNMRTCPDPIVFLQPKLYNWMENYQGPFWVLGKTPSFLP